MSDDILSWLRHEERSWDENFGPGGGDTFRRAADEIEGLRETLQGVTDRRHALESEIERLTLPPGTWRVTVADDGTRGVVPLALAEMPWIRIDGRLAPIADRPLWFDAAPTEGDA